MVVVQILEIDIPFRFRRPNRNAKKILMLKYQLDLRLIVSLDLQL
ncbi:hypothetical protein SAMN04488122_1807 [Chitinophaga arvensicola]|uniref:Uncharacterized protein n=1 Tax=Chitinophaga arvensicola TaxID=29529 RepID=A0A1I0QWX9_9BACT|nr:hypothetical protein SAMN04488122_1807 [Chitinophaga arvensicola]